MCNNWGTKINFAKYKLLAPDICTTSIARHFLENIREVFQGKVLPKFTHRVGLVMFLFGNFSQVK